MTPHATYGFDGRRKSNPPLTETTDERRKVTVFVDACVRRCLDAPGYEIDVGVQYTNTTGRVVLISPSDAVFELLDSELWCVQRHIPGDVPAATTVRQGQAYRFEVTFPIQADVLSTQHSLLCVIAEESSYSLVRIRSALCMDQREHFSAAI